MTVAGALAVALLAGAAPAGPAPPPEASSAIERAATARVIAALPQRTVPEASPALAAAARSLAAAAAAGDPRPLSARALRRALDDAGVHDPAPASVVLAAPPASLPEALAAAARFRGATHVGVGVVERDGLAWGVLLATERRAEIERFPRRVAPGAEVALRGRLLGLDAPRAWAARPSGAVAEIALQVEGSRFSGTLSFPEPGTWRIEVGGTGARGPTVAALFDVVCGDAPPDPTPAGGSKPTDDASALARIRAEVDALRARQGLPPLRPSPALDAIARRHAEAMLSASTLAHRLPGGGDLAARLAEASVTYRSARENVARGDGALDAHRATVESPAHLANLLDGDVRLLGLGIARGALPGGQPVVYLAEVLLEPLGPFPVGDPPTGAR